MPVSKMPRPIEVATGDLINTSTTMLHAIAKNSPVVQGCPGMLKKGRGALGIAGVATAKDCERDGGKSEKRIVHACDVVEDLIVASG